MRPAQPAHRVRRPGPYPRRPFRLLPLLALLATAALPAQTTYRIAGTVLSGLSHQPVQRASVFLASVPDLKPVQTTTADEFGRFAFSNVPAGSYRLRGQAPGFASTTYLEHGMFSTAIVTGANVDTESLVLTLRSLGSISGTVTDESAEPVRNAQVHLFFRDPLAGDSSIRTSGTTTTNDLGHFEFPRLLPATYFVAVTAQPWYATHPNPQIQPLQGLGVVPSVDPTLDVAYPITYYPGATEAARAAAISIDGNAARADLQLTPTPAVTLTLPRDPNTRNVSIPQLQASIFGHPAFVNVQPRVTQTETVLTGLAPGDYSIRTFAQAQPGSPPQRSTEGTVHLTREGAATASGSAETATLHVQLRSSDGSPLSRDLFVSLFRTGTRDVAASATADAHGAADLTAPSGAYFLNANQNGAFLFLRGLASADQSLPDGTLNIAPGSSLSVTAAVERGTHTLHGVLQNEGKPCAGAMLLLIPAEAHPDLRTVFRDQSDLDGSFNIANLAPGPYLLVALEDGWSLDWRSSDFLARYLPHSLPVLIPNTAATTQALPNPIQVQRP